MKIVVLSCDKDTDLFYPFHCCIEKYWQDHPEIIYATETVNNPYYKTICRDYPLEKWTKRIRESLSEIDDDKILVIADDIFIKAKVDTSRIDYLLSLDWKNVACFNFEKQFDNNDLDTDVVGFKKRRRGSKWELSIMCGLWDKDKFIDILSNDSDPWSVEENKDTKGYDFYINSGDYIIDWGYVYGGQAGLWHGKWTRHEADWLTNNGFVIDFDVRGYYENLHRNN